MGSLFSQIKHHLDSFKYIVLEKIRGDRRGNQLLQHEAVWTFMLKAFLPLGLNASIASIDVSCIICIHFVFCIFSY